MNQNPNSHEPDELDRAMAIALQEKGVIIPLDLDDVLDDDFAGLDLPERLRDSSRLLAAVIADAPPARKGTVVSFAPPVNADDEYAKAARHGEKLSEETLRKLRELRGDNS